MDGGGFIMPETIVKIKPDHITQKIWLTSPGENRANKRSETPKGFARAVFEANYQNSRKAVIPCDTLMIRS